MSDTMSFGKQSVTSPPTLVRHLYERYKAAGGQVDYDEGNVEIWLDGLVKFCDEEMTRNGLVGTGYSDSGMTGTLQDGTVVLLSPTREHVTRESGVFGVGNVNVRGPHADRYEPHVVRVTDPNQR